MSENTTVSVVIPTFNRLELLKRSLASVRSQTLAPREIIVVDDGSNDGTAEYLRNIPVKLIRQPNRGPGAARNAGMDQALGEYVAFLDSDDMWFPWTMEAVFQSISKHNFPTIIAGRFVEFADEAQLASISEQPLSTAWYRDYFASSRQAYVVGSGTCALKRAAAGQIRFSENRLNAEDHDLILRLGTHPGFVQIRAPVTVAWCRHGSSETANLVNSALGSRRLVECEKSGLYPGGAARTADRRRIITRHTRPVTINCLRQGSVRHAWQLYLLTLRWNLGLGHWRYVTGMPLVAVLVLLRRMILSLWLLHQARPDRQTTSSDVL